MKGRCKSGLFDDGKRGFWQRKRSRKGDSPWVDENASECFGDLETRAWLPEEGRKKESLGHWVWIGPKVRWEGERISPSIRAVLSRSPSPAVLVILCSSPPSS
ncbi:hypothetical protein Droror1_Dr00000616 [Drosera rotundifolia]